MGSKGNYLIFKLTKGNRGPQSEYAKQEPGWKPRFTDFQLNPFPVGYTALNELLDKGISKI